METKVFVGIRLTSELKPYLTESGLLKTLHEEKEYIGAYAPLHPTLDQISTLSQTVTAELASLLPTQRVSIVIFPQLLLG